MIGRECSLAIPGSRRRERGFVGAGHGENQVIACLYPKATGQFEKRIATTDEVRILKAGPPPGWRKLQVLSKDGEPRISLRLQKREARLFVQGVEQGHFNVEAFFNQAIQEQLGYGSGHDDQ